ncbi:MAG: phosphatase PAP2 family protein [Butyrivibrio sp.]|nr:phosphatase PAP2 family protein [Butyrivibrio sp.]
MDTKNKNYTRPLALLAITAIFSVLATVIDRQAIGPDNTVVGFASLNGAFAGRFGYNSIFDTISDLAMVIAFAVVASFAILGVYKLIREKSLSKVGKVIIGLGILYVAVAVIYVVFGKIPINYRPVLQPGETELETSYPSTHTLIICSVLGSAIPAWKRLIKNPAVFKVLKIAAFAVMVIGVAARMFAGVHWLTDIFAGILFSLTLKTFYAAWSLD